MFIVFWYFHIAYNKRKHNKNYIIICLFLIFFWSNVCPSVTKTEFRNRLGTHFPNIRNMKIKLFYKIFQQLIKFLLFKQDNRCFFQKTWILGNAMYSRSVSRLIKAFFNWRARRQWENDRIWKETRLPTILPNFSLFPPPLWIKFPMQINLSSSIFDWALPQKTLIWEKSSGG